MEKIDVIAAQFKKAFTRLDAVLKKRKNEFIRDAAIQRFEFTFDISWKLLKVLLEERSGTVCNSPKSCFREAYKEKWIEGEDFWMEITNMRNLVSHTYNEETAELIYAKLPEILKYFKKLKKLI